MKGVKLCHMVYHKNLLLLLLTCALAFSPDLQTNVGTVDAHVADYQRMIDNLQV